MESIITSLQDFFACSIAGMSVIGIVIFWLAIAFFGLFWLFFIRIYIAYRMAKNRHRDPIGWVLLSLFFSPLFTWIALLIVGDDH